MADFPEEFALDLAEFIRCCAAPADASPFSALHKTYAAYASIHGLSQMSGSNMRTVLRGMGYGLVYAGPGAYVVLGITVPRGIWPAPYESETV